MIPTKTKGTEKLTNVKVKLNVPEGTVFVKPIQKYIANPGTENEEIIENEFILGLRKIKGINKNTFYNKYNLTPQKFNI